MKLQIQKDYFDNPTPPHLFLCQTNKEIIGELHADNISLDGKWNSYSELSFSIDRTYTDELTGEHKVDPLFDLAEGLRVVKVDGIGYFQIQDPDTTYSDKDSKTLSCFSLEYSTASKYLDTFVINTGADESYEVTYWASQLGNNYFDKNEYYKTASPTYDPYIQYYVKTPKNNSFVYEKIAVNEDDFPSHFGEDVPPEEVLYVVKYRNIQFYNPQVPELSLLHIIFQKIPEWSIGYVDSSLYKQERTFENDRISVYDFMMNDMSDTFKCVVSWNTLTNTVDFYEEAEDGITDDNTVQTRFDTDVYITKDNLASSINIKYSTDNIKTRLKVTGGDDLDIREVNAGSNYITNLDYYTTPEWMGTELANKYTLYKTFLVSKTSEYYTLSQGRVGAYNKYNTLMNNIPVDGNVVRIGDAFTKLYCLYGQNIRATKWYSGFEYYTDLACTTLANPQPTSSNFSSGGPYYIKNKDSKAQVFTDTLTRYHVYEDTQANKSDNILLRLKNNNSDTVTIRVYNSGTTMNPIYQVQCVTLHATSGITENPVLYNLSQWIDGDITATALGIQGDGFTISYIGILGAYFVLAKDETVKENMQDYGVRLLEEKQQTYLTVFQTQTEAMFSENKNKCVVSDEPPTGNDIPEGTRWLDTNSSPVKLYSYVTSGGIGHWNLISASISTDDQKNYENYQRYIDNYDKLVVVQELFVEKQKDADFYRNGVTIPDKPYINPNTATQPAFADAARQYFKNEEPANPTYNATLKLYTFTRTIDNKQYTIYLNGTTPYICYAGSQAVYQLQMNAIAQSTNMQSPFVVDGVTYQFTEGELMRLSPFIREDEFSDSNCALTGYESEEQRLEICNELLRLADKELKTLSQPSLEFSMTMANILALPEFEPIKNQFALGNFIRVGLPNNMVKRARLLEVHLNFDDMSDFSANFGNLITTKSEIDKHAELLAQAVSAGKQVASNASNWQKAVDKSTSLDKAINEGLKDAALAVASSSGQDITWDSRGILCRKKQDGYDDVYMDEQLMLTNNKLVYTNDNWQTSKGVFGSFKVGDTTYSGVLADALVGGYIEGSSIVGGTLQIGDPNGTYFAVDNQGNVAIKSGGQNVYANKSSVEQLEEAMKYTVEITYTGSTIFSDPSSSCVLTCNVYKTGQSTPMTMPTGTTYSWIRNSNTSDSTWNTAHANQTTNTITITNADVDKNATFSCKVKFDDTTLNS